MASITGYGQTGPWAAHAGHDINYVATAGALGLNGARGQAPVPLGVQVADIGGGGLQPAVAILGALVGVLRGGEGRWLDVSMTDGAVSWLALALAQRDAGDPTARGDQRLGGRYACYRVYECKDGRYYSVAALESKFWIALCEALGRTDLVELQYSEDKAVQATMEDIFRARTREEWERVLAPIDACCEPVLDLDEVTSHPQVAARGLVSQHGRGPSLGEHTDEVLRELGL